MSLKCIVCDTSFFCHYYQNTSPFFSIILVDYLLKNAISDVDSGVVTHPRHSRHYPVSVKWPWLRWWYRSLESTIHQAQAQLTSTAAEVKDLGLIISVLKTEYMTVNCHPHPTWSCGNKVDYGTKDWMNEKWMTSDTSTLKWHLLQVTLKGARH